MLLLFLLSFEMAQSSRPFFFFLFDAHHLALMHIIILVSTEADCVLAETCHSLTISAGLCPDPLALRGQEDLPLSSHEPESEY